MTFSIVSKLTEDEASGVLCMQYALRGKNADE
jgi:hypothetical protein